MNNFFRVAKPEDFDKLNLLEVYAADPFAVEKCKPSLDNPLDAVFTILGSHGEPIAIVGGTLLYSRVMEMWALAGREIRQNRKRYSVALRYLMQAQFEERGLKRIQIVMRADQPWAARWAHFLGLDFEVTLKNYGEENTDYFLFSRVRD